MKWIPPINTYGQLKNYHLQWGIKNGTLRTELVDPTKLIWISDFLDDDLDHVFKLSAVNDLGFGDPVIRWFKTPKQKIIIPPNVTVKEVKKGNKSMLQVRWDQPLHPVRGYEILYRKFEWVFTGRWQLKKINDPTALSSEIIVNENEESFIVLVKGRPARRRRSSFQQPK